MTHTRLFRSAVALSNAFGVGVNDLPLSFVLSWYEQKAVAILEPATLGDQGYPAWADAPGIRGTHVADVLVKDFGIKPITTAEKDLAAILGKAS